jgi:ABC-type transporter Mla subunit MlaD
MRRILAIAVLAAAVSALLVAGVAAGDGDDGSYRVRAIFDNGGFLVKGEQVRIAGANVGTVDSVDVTGEDEPAHVDGSPDPGKAVVVLKIDDGGFQDFRVDASCLIRPQSLLGEKYVDCLPTQPRAAGQPAPKELAVIPEGEPGAGERILPLENNGKAVDLDLVNDINRLPYAQRLRLILNDLGAGVAARGKELASIIERANPALKQTDRVLAILAAQNHTLANLARDGDQIMSALARQREHLTGFINNAQVAAEATAERAPDLEASLQKFPGFLRELRSTMTDLKAFADAGTPTVSALGAAAPGLTRTTKALGPFAKEGTGALTSLGDTVQQSGPDLIASDPLINDLRRLGDATTPAAKPLNKLLASLQRTGGYQHLLRFVYRTVGSTNGFDQFGHFLRAVLVITGCQVYAATPSTDCGAHFGKAPINTQAAPARAQAPSPKEPTTTPLAKLGTAITRAFSEGSASADSTPPAGAGDRNTGQASDTGQGGESTPPAEGATADSGSTTPALKSGGASMRDARLLMRYFLGGDR